METLVVPACTAKNVIILATSSVIKGNVFHKEEYCLHELKQDWIFSNPNFFHMLNEASGTFMTLQRFNKIKDRSDNLWLNQISLQYRCILRACIERCTDDDDDRNVASDNHQLAAVCTRIEFIWNFLDIMFVNAYQSALILPEILEWIQVHFHKCEEMTERVLKEGTLDAHSEYWHAVFGYVVQGRMQDARRLLAVHSTCHLEAFMVMDSLLDAMPVCHRTTTMPVMKYTMQWRTWQQEIMLQQNQGTFSQESHLIILANLLTGNESTIIEVQKLLQLTWYEVLAVWLLFVEPATQKAEVRTRASVVVDLCQECAKEPTDAVLWAAMDGNAYEVVKQLQLTFDNVWLTAHLTDLLIHAARRTGLAHNHQLRGVTHDLREQLLTEMVDLMMAQSSLWQLGLAYLDHCPSKGASFQKLCLDRMPIDSEYIARKILVEAKKRDHKGIVRNVCSKQAHNALQRGNFGQALSWAVRGEDAVIATIIADLLLNRYVKTAAFEIEDILESLGINMLLSDRLTFLVKYYEFHELYSKQKYNETLRLLNSILVCGVTPKKFWKVLMCDAIPLLQNRKVRLSPQNVKAFATCISNATQFGVQDGKREENAFLKEKVLSARLALAQAHAHSIAMCTHVQKLRR